MKTNKLKTFLLALCCTVSFTSCINNDEPQDKVETMDAQVSPYTSFSGVLMSDEIFEGMSVKVGSSPKYNFMGLSSIEGFTYERGYEYKLKIQRTTLANPPADGSSYTYKLIKILSKQKAEGTRTEVTLYVSSEIGKFKYGALTQDMPSKGMKIRENEKDDWTVGPFNRISGFDYEQGFNYVLSVEKIALPESSPFDYYQPIQYVLLKVISKEKAVS